MCPIRWDLPEQMDEERARAILKQVRLGDTLPLFESSETGLPDGTGNGGQPSPSAPSGARPVQAASVPLTIWTSGPIGQFQGAAYLLLSSAGESRDGLTCTLSFRMSPTAVESVFHGALSGDRGTSGMAGLRFYLTIRTGVRPTTSRSTSRKNRSTGAS